MNFRNISMSVVVSSILLVGCGTTGGNENDIDSSSDIIVLPSVNSVNVKQLDNQKILEKPTSPKNQRAIAEDGVVKLIWTDTSDNESGFKILRDNKIIASLDADTTGFIDFNAIAGVKHTYSIQPFNAKGSASCDVSCTVKEEVVKVDKPSSPLNLTAETTADSVQLEWKVSSCSSCISTYRLYRNGTLVSTIDGENTTYMDTGLIPNAKLVYTLYASNSSGTSNPAVVVTTTKDADLNIDKPVAPSNLQVEIKSANCVKLTWDDNSNNENLYQIFKNGVLLTTGDKDIVKTYATGLKPDTTYTFIVKAINGGGASSSQEVTILTPSADKYINDKAPAAVSDVSASMDTDGSVNLSWKNNADNNKGYKIYRNGCMVGCIDDPSITTFTDENAKDGETYTYEVKAFNYCGTTSILETIVLTGGDTSSIAKQYNVPICQDQIKISFYSIHLCYYF